MGRTRETVICTRRHLVREGSRPLASSEYGCGSCCGIRSIITSSVVADRCSRTAVMPVRGCLERAMVQMVTDRLIRLPASLPGVRITRHGRWRPKRWLVGNTERMNRKRLSTCRVTQGNEGNRDRRCSCADEPVCSNAALSRRKNSCKDRRR